MGLLNYLREQLNPPSSVMDRKYVDRSQWQPEYENEPALQPPMISPDDLIGTGIPNKLAGLLAAGGKGVLTSGGLLGIGTIAKKGKGVLDALNSPTMAGIDKNSMLKGAKQVGEYQIEHKPMNVDGGAALLHDLENVFGPDVYGKNALQYFGSGGYRNQEKAALELMRKVKGNPDAPVTIYRGVPDGVGKINPGDWVTLSPDMAAEYGNVIQQIVPAKHITSWPDSLLEYGYFPDK